MYSLTHTDGTVLFTSANWFTIAAELRANGVHYLMVEAIQAWFDMGRGKQFPINGYLVTEL